MVRRQEEHIFMAKGRNFLRLRILLMRCKKDRRISIPFI